VKKLLVLKVLNDVELVVLMKVIELTEDLLPSDDSSHYQLNDLDTHTRGQDVRTSAVPKFEI
jgi:hypothetical protein